MSLQSAMAFIAACRDGAMSREELDALEPDSIRPALFDRAWASGYAFSGAEFEQALRLDILARLATARRPGSGRAAQ